MTLKELNIGESAVIRTVGGDGALRQHFLDMGVIPGAEVTVVKLAPMGDPMELQIHGYELTLRLADADQIEVEPIKSRSRKHEGPKSISDTEHPGLGESGKYHVKATEDPLPDGMTLTYALVGNQNCGKTTLFNQLTGANQHVGNFPGVTVDRKDGPIKGYPNTSVTDLPGIYSMSPYTSEEIVSRNFVLQDKPKAIINIVDATNIERNLYLTMQLLEMDVPMVLALNMMDEVTGNGGTIDVNRMEEILGIPVIPISAAKNQGVDELIRHAIHIAKYQERPGRQDFCDENDFGEAVPFVMELPNYRLPGAKNVAQLLWEKAKDFLQRAFSVILIATVVIWFLQSFDLRFNMVEDSSKSILAMAAGWIAPLFAPIGLGDWRIVTSLISGFMAKESVVSTLQVLFHGGVQSVLTSLSAASLLVFSLLYTPCVAAIASVRREMGRHWAIGVVLWQCAIAWVAAAIVRVIGLLIF